MHHCSGLIFDFLDCTDEVYGSGRLEGQGGPLDNMRALEHYLPDPGNSRGSYADNKGKPTILGA